MDAIYPRAFWITKFIFFSLFDTAFVSSGCQLSSTSTITIPHLEQTCLLEFDRNHGYLSLSFFFTCSRPGNRPAPRWSLISAHTHTVQCSQNFNLRTWTFNLRSHLKPRAPTFRIQLRTLNPWYRDVEFNFQSTLLDFDFLLDFQFNQPPCSIRCSTSSSPLSEQRRNRDN
jgi:hypothetical protein